MKISCIIAITLALTIGRTFAQGSFITAASGSWTDVTNAVAQASPGTTVIIPPGTNNWPGELNLFGVSLLASNCNVSITGIANTPTLIYASASSNEFVTIKGFTFDTTATGPLKSIIEVDGSNVCFHINDCKFLNSSRGSGTAFGIQIGGLNTNRSAGPYGLIDNCQFYWPAGQPYNFVNVRANGCNDTLGNPSQWPWTQPMTWGTTNTVVIENCAFSVPDTLASHHVAEADAAARLCIRYCTMTNVEEGTHGLNSGAHVGTLQVEFYNNYMMFNYTNNTEAYAFISRGGSSLIFSNVITQSDPFCIGWALQFWVECASSDWQGEFCPKQLIYPTDYPATNQIGRGVVSGMEGSQPTYIWSNSISSNYPQIGLGIDSDSAFIVQGRDVYTNSPMPGYTPLIYPHPLADTNCCTCGGGSGADITNGLVAEYKFNGDVTDNINGNNGSTYGGPGFTTGEDAVANHAIQFNGTSQGVNVLNAAPLNPTTAITVSCWIDQSSTGMPFEKGNFSEYFVYAVNGGQVGVHIYTSSGDLGETSASNFSSGNWHFFAATWDSGGDGKIRVYKDGVLDATSSTSLAGTIYADGAYGLHLGSGASGYYYGGAEDDTRIYNRSLSGSEISTLYSNGAK